MLLHRRKLHLVLLLWIYISVVNCFRHIGVKYHITLNIFSGRENPEWMIDSNDLNYDDIALHVNTYMPVKIPDSVLGYAGFTVTAINIYEEKLETTVGRCTDDTLEQLLLLSCTNNAVSLEIQNYVISEINKQVVLSSFTYDLDLKKRKKRQALNLLGGINLVSDLTHQTSSTRRRSGSRRKLKKGKCAKKFKPWNWNYHPVQRRNNCYNYATDKRTNTFAQPGRGSLRKFTLRKASDVYKASVRDGLSPLTSPDAGKDCLIALVIWPGQDYHFYRQDNDGSWSHKAGKTMARDYDDSYDRITDPRTANRGPYSVFAGWLGVNKKVTLR